LSDTAKFQDRFLTRQQAERYRDRFRSRRARIDRVERVALREILAPLGRVAVALDLPSGTGRLAPVLAEVAERLILADGSPVMLELAREDFPTLPAEILQTDAQHIKLAEASVDLVFSHRFLGHIYNIADRTNILKELARVTRHYVVLSFYRPSLRSRWRQWLKRLLSGRANPAGPMTVPEFLAEVQAAGLVLRQTRWLRRFPSPSAFFLFERISSK
jgi:ubiquinone/menaquinone biosynthesis C-methylase UbiE